ncbi:YeeE/YedE family protein [Pseudonocardiaceae bacterium YIM PH 21723]|nr:YeeE/YedE family protein [Pseudonocardiaceae bacterium YIM PH 21723]
MTTDVTTCCGAKPKPEPKQPPAQLLVIGIGAVLTVLVGLAVASVAGAKLAVLFVLGLALGLVLFHSRFGFSSAWRQLVSVGQGQAIRAHSLMLAVACVLFAIILGFGWSLSGTPQPMLAPAGWLVVIGAFLFGIGMQIGGSCASGTLFAIGSGHTAILFTLGGFIAGSIWQTFNAPFWTANVPAGKPVSLATSLGYPGALAVSLLVLGLITAASLWWQKRKQPPVIEPQPHANGLLRAIRGAWPLWVGAILLAVLNAATLFISGGAWGITFAFALWGAKILTFFGVDVASWPFWKTPANAAALHGSVLANKISVMDLGIILGALIASAAAGAFILHRRIPWKLALGSVIGGVLMGYGARLSGGCNIGAYFSGVASFSLHGWLWGATALVGTYAGLLLRPVFGLANPKPTDAVC